RVEPDNPYHAAVMAAASDEVIFPGAIYDKATVQALRFHARAYCHGHTVGGTNPSLVEALWCGNAVLAHRNRFNVWTAGAEQFFFSDVDECERMIQRILTDDLAAAGARGAARLRAAADFDWSDILPQYERELAALGGYTLASEAPAQLEPARRARLPGPAGGSRAAASAARWRPAQCSLRPRSSAPLRERQPSGCAGV